ncbi:MAG: Asp-tRNA(Asn)/Glu-tRNA(Gln) amidotransferase subunit GatC [Planctomycetes bacterium]|nr:Asp-tRNA(Asn)/Glu-tRNA(Gln) amidotransferase subunit GatC [Planctomycetota bacterium]
MKVDPALVDHVARLARLGLTPDDRLRYVSELTRILAYVEKLNTLDVAGAEPLVHPFEGRNVFRPDAVQASPPPEDGLANAPDRIEKFFKVPKVIE